MIVSHEQTRVQEIDHDQKFETFKLLGTKMLNKEPTK